MNINNNEPNEDEKTTQKDLFAELMNQTEGSTDIRKIRNNELENT